MEEEIQEDLSNPDEDAKDEDVNAMLDVEGFEIATKQEFSIGIMRIQTEAKSKMEAQEAHYKVQFDKLKKKLEAKNELLKERTDKLMRIEAVQTDLREEVERITDEKRELEQSLHAAKQESEMKILGLEGLITQLRIDLGNKDKEIEQLKNVLEKSIKTREISKEDAEKRKEREERRRSRREKMAAYEAKKGGTPETPKEPETEPEPSESAILETEEEIEGKSEEISPEEIQENVRTQVTSKLSERANDKMSEFAEQLAGFDDELAELENRSNVAKSSLKKNSKGGKKSAEKEGESSAAAPKRTKSGRRRTSLRNEVTESDTKQLDKKFSGAFTLCDIDKKLGLVFDKKKTRSMTVKKLKSDYPKKLGIAVGDSMTRINGKSLGILIYKDAVKILKTEPFPWKVEFMRMTPLSKIKK